MESVKLVNQMTVVNVESSTARIVIEPEIVEYAKWVAPIIAERSHKSIGVSNNLQGILGQELFNGFLMQCRIPNLYANAIYKEMRMRQIDGKHFDFVVPHMTQDKRIISVKTVPEGANCKRFLANVESWNNEAHDIVVAVKIESLRENKAYLAGWMTAETVTTLPIHDLGEGDAYWTYLNPETVEHMKAKEHSGTMSPKLKPLNHIEPLIYELCSGSFDPAVRSDPLNYIRGWNKTTA